MENQSRMGAGGQARRKTEPGADIASERLEIDIQLPWHPRVADAPAKELVRWPVKPSCCSSVPRTKLNLISSLKWPTSQMDPDASGEGRAPGRSLVKAKLRG